MPNLGVNIDHVATVRQARRGSSPDVMTAAVHAEMGGADSITVHLREDRRHIQEADVRILRQSIATRLNLEMAATGEILAIALEVVPNQCTLVPERRQELTTEGGLDLTTHHDAVAAAIDRLQTAGIPVSLFIDPDEAAVAAAAHLGARAVELHTGEYAAHPGEAQLDRLRRALHAGLAAGLTVHAGHGLDYDNAGPLAQLPGFSEFNIGHAIICRALFVGLVEAVAEMKQLVRYNGHDPRGIRGNRPPRR
ncbi:MAG: pyridoxine 5'-phosphate synthase [Nitrospirae bacterium CG18_big_fil_WC_8_21_14_2_50_70_55]|nr:pyridoxine 5'-phosphate synthase [Deltaproteobacteria bacterium]OIP66490.1 MAG: pyridoxine 5'-phosphate synthase [Nitrospirae bacterium CG2_30_70_394]PIQ06913.1 MAG: pyridoxine 5'-phosphate synthase [Nitrospirae bacterium CG18_big_fil_WC_8_21_14_2_50_70_55]PIU79642.1 MAG: pyridoxine 5'-phosphate synthase [Nitrospirae bacterium CG06_land_8_20_14_3_00_70_43]PIW83585.1 MAG: pyridoxine 5'-phosphate synthase [Nitrospirae bacterium CG_4_8_14_3_um_filter_70_85]PIX82994.1 MAG: pyridoxine 5'-phospha